VNDLSGGGGGPTNPPTASITNLSTFGGGRIAVSSPIDRYHQPQQQQGGYYPMTYGMMSGPGRPSLRSPDDQYHHHHHLQELPPPLHHHQNSSASFNPSDSE